MILLFLAHSKLRNAYNYRSIVFVAFPQGWAHFSHSELQLYVSCIVGDKVLPTFKILERYLRLQYTPKTSRQHQKVTLNYSDKKKCLYVTRQLEGPHQEECLYQKFMHSLVIGK